MIRNRGDGGSLDQEGKDVSSEEFNVIHATLIIMYLNTPF